MRVFARTIGALARLASDIHMMHAGYHDWRARVHEGRTRIHESRRDERLAEAARIDGTAVGLVGPRKTRKPAPSPPQPTVETRPPERRALAVAYASPPAHPNTVWEDKQ